MARLMPHRLVEDSSFASGARYVAGMDEVGRGALAGPVTVGVVVIEPATRALVEGVRDSKLLSASQRERVLPQIRSWCTCHAIGHASAGEIDAVGIVSALRIAALRALAALSVAPDVVVLDGVHDWLSDSADPLAEAMAPPTYNLNASVITQVKADRDCASVAAASIVAKCQRDAYMVELSEQYPAYGWASNKGYGSATHVEALRQFGPTELHRRSWNLPGLGSGENRWTEDASGKAGRKA